MSIYIRNLTLTISQPAPPTPSWTDCFATKDGRIVVVGGAAQILVYNIASQTWTGASGELSNNLKLGPTVSVNPFHQPAYIQARILADGVTALVVCTLLWTSQSDPYYLDTTTWTVSRAIGTPETTPVSGGGATASGWAPVPGGGPVLPPSGFRHYSLAIVGQDPDEPKEHYGNGHAFLVGGYSTLITGEVKDWDALTSIPVQQAPSKEMARFGNAGTLPKITRGASAFDTGSNTLTVFPGNGGRQSATDLSQVVYRVNTNTREITTVAPSGGYWPKNAIFRSGTVIGRSNQVLLHGGLSTLEFTGSAPPVDAFLSSSSSFAVYDGHSQTFVNNVDKYVPKKSYALIIGLSVGGAVLVALIVGGIIWFRKRQRSKRDEEAERAAKGMILKSENELQHLDDKQYRMNRISQGVHQGGEGGSGGELLGMRLSEEQNQTLLRNTPYQSMPGTPVGSSVGKAQGGYYSNLWTSIAAKQSERDLPGCQGKSGIAVSTAGSNGSYAQIPHAANTVPPSTASYALLTAPADAQGMRNIPPPPSLASPRAANSPQEFAALSPVASTATPASFYVQPQSIRAQNPQQQESESLADPRASLATSRDSTVVEPKMDIHIDSKIKVLVDEHPSETVDISGRPSSLPQHIVNSPPTASSVGKRASFVTTSSSSSPYMDVSTVVSQPSTTSLQSQSQASSSSPTTTTTTRDRRRTLELFGIRPSEITPSQQQERQTSSATNPDNYHHYHHDTSVSDHRASNDLQSESNTVVHADPSTLVRKSESYLEAIRSQQRQQPHQLSSFSSRASLQAVTASQDSSHPPIPGNPHTLAAAPASDATATSASHPTHPYGAEVYTNIAVPVVYTPAAWTPVEQPMTTTTATDPKLGSLEADSVSRHQADMQSQQPSSIPPTFPVSPPPLPLASRPPQTVQQAMLKDP
ncbi:hypothetical protein BGW42_000970 [Actinomortierella wolfii]|nr:hypothetical protein BGW42_000970 [Actinomortierella wolfii]